MNIRYITAIHMEGGNRHEHIAEVQYFGISEPAGRSTTSSMVRWVSTTGNEARVEDPPTGSYVRVGVVKVNPPYLRTYRDDRPTDNLLHLPTY